MTLFAVRPQQAWAAAAGSATRQLAAVTAAGGLLGLLVGGVGGRLAMLLLARLNPDATGLVSDDRFIIGQLTTESLNLLVDGTLLGVLGGGIYFVLRGLMIGPRWFQVLSISVGPAVVMGSQIVHTNGVDFTTRPRPPRHRPLRAHPWDLRSAPHRRRGALARRRWTLRDVAAVGGCPTPAVSR